MSFKELEYSGLLTAFGIRTELVLFTHQLHWQIVRGSAFDCTMTTGEGRKGCQVRVGPRRTKYSDIQA